MTALVRYQLELLVRSQRWLPPVLAYVLLMVVGVTAGESLLGAYGFAGAVLVPVAAWLVRCVVEGESAASRACVAAAVGAVRVYLSAVVAAGLGGLLLGSAGWLVVSVLGGRVAAQGSGALGTALAAGLLSTVVCLVLGLAVGVVCSRPVLLRRQYGIPLSLALATAALVLSGSPANAAVRSLVGANRAEQRLELPFGAAAEAVLLLVAVVAGAAVLVGRRAE